MVHCSSQRFIDLQLAQRLTEARPRDAGRLGPAVASASPTFCPFSFSFFKFKMKKRKKEDQKVVRELDGKPLNFYFSQIFGLSFVRG